MPNPVSSADGAQFEVVELPGDSRSWSDPGNGSDVLAVGAEPSQFVLPLRRTTNLLGSIRVRLGIGVAVLGALGIVFAVGPTGQVSFPRPAARPPVVIGCPPGKHCATRLDPSSAVAAALASADPASSPVAESTYDTSSGQIYRTTVAGSNGARQYQIESSCLPGGPAPLAQPIEAQHIDSSGAMPGFGGYTAVSVTRVRDTACAVHIAAVAPDTASGALRPGISPSPKFRMHGGSAAESVLFALLRDPRIWLGR
ncbi:MAG: hypothetical protein ACR2KJ_14595 [Jatrophihabitans sp.]